MKEQAESYFVARTIKCSQAWKSYIISILIEHLYEESSLKFSKKIKSNLCLTFFRNTGVHNP